MGIFFTSCALGTLPGRFSITMAMLLVKTQKFGQKANFSQNCAQVHGITYIVMTYLH